MVLFGQMQCVRGFRTTIRDTVQIDDGVSSLNLHITGDKHLEMGVVYA